MPSAFDSGYDLDESISWNDHLLDIAASRLGKDAGLAECDDRFALSSLAAAPLGQPGCVHPPVTLDENASGAERSG